MNNRDFGYDITFGTMLYGSAIMLYAWGAYFVMCRYLPGLLTLFDRNKYAFIFLFLVISGLITFPYSYRNDIYLRYFEEFDKIKGRKRLAYKALTFSVMAGSLVFWIWAMTFSSGGHLHDSDKFSKQAIVNGYELIERSNMNRIVLTPAAKAEWKPDGDRNSTDLLFSEQLLSLFDTALLKNSYSVSVCNEIIRSPDGDTISVSIYDFIDEQGGGKIAGLFKDSPFREVFVGIFEAPITCLYFSNNGNLCGVCRVGLYREKNIKNELFTYYMEQQADDRLKQEVSNLKNRNYEIR